MFKADVKLDFQVSDKERQSLSTMVIYNIDWVVYLIMKFFVIRGAYQIWFFLSLLVINLLSIF